MSKMSQRRKWRRAWRARPRARVFALSCGKMDWPRRGGFRSRGLPGNKGTCSPEESRTGPSFLSSLNGLRFCPQDFQAMRWPSARKSHLRPTRMNRWFAAASMSLVLFFCGPNREVSLRSDRTALAGCADGGRRPNHVTECPCGSNRPIWYTDFAGGKPGTPDDPGRTTERSTRAA
jgi:hypothetical protein